MTQRRETIGNIIVVSLLTLLIWWWAAGENEFNRGFSTTSRSAS